MTNREKAEEWALQYYDRNDPRFYAIANAFEAGIRSVENDKKKELEDDK